VNRAGLINLPIMTGAKVIPSRLVFKTENPQRINAANPAREQWFSSRLPEAMNA